MQKVIYQDLGMIDYEEAWNLQRQLHQQLIDKKLENRNLISAGLNPLPQSHYMLFCEHPPVFTLGKSGSVDHLLLDEENLQTKGFTFFKINRGGDITYHGPGQLVGYPIFDLDCFFTDVHRYVRALEEAVILLLAGYGLTGVRIKEYTGVWLDADGRKPQRKICAIGVHLSRWVTMHGFALNVNTDLSHFDFIIPCGISDADKAVTSLAAELGEDIPMQEVKSALMSHFAEVFGYKYA
ncbi:MAG: lipoyl(octanoyl) transferase LipB [Saprospiraceae bacterium]|jgi:lipoyl(octanoyl) transferase|nr:lipoyl(octanoyl) transferase LipB [Saprospiraceae bacterium]